MCTHSADLPTALWSRGVAPLVHLALRENLVVFLLLLLARVPVVVVVETEGLARVQAGQETMVVCRG